MKWQTRGITFFRGLITRRASARSGKDESPWRGSWPGTRMERTAVYCFDRVDPGARTPPRTPTRTPPRVAGKSRGFFRALDDTPQGKYGRSLNSSNGKHDRVKGSPSREAFERRFHPQFLFFPVQSFFTLHFFPPAAAASSSRAERPADRGSGQWETRIDEEINGRSPLIRNSRLRFTCRGLLADF